MKRFLRIAAIILILVQLFVIPAAAAYSISRSTFDVITSAAGNAPTTPSGAQEGSAAAENAENEAQQREAEVMASVKENAEATAKVTYEIAPVTEFGSEEDVMIGGLLIQPGVWYTVDSEGVLTSAEAWPNSYLYYSASQSKLTLHEFHYRVPTDTIGKDMTYASLYLPKDMHIVLEGDNELINTSYTTAGGGVSNGVYAPGHHISFEGNGALYVNTRSADGSKGYGIQAGSIRIDSDFTGLAVFGMTSAFSCAPSVAESREMIANVADLHPQYHGNVRVREASPYDSSIFTRFRYVLFAVGKELSWEQQIKAQIEAEYYRSKMEYNLGVEQGYAEAYDSFTTEVGNLLTDFGSGMDQEINNMNSELNIELNHWDENTVGSQLLQMLMGGN